MATSTIAEFIEEHELKATITEIDARPDDLMPDASFHWRVIIRSPRSRMTVYFSHGSARPEAPTLADVLECMSSDLAGYLNAGSFEDWCADYGYDTDSRHAERIYKAIEKEANALLRVLGDDEAVEALAFGVEWL